MFFYIDEAGNTGNNLFDNQQKILSYGVLSCKTNIDLLCIKKYQDILQELEAKEIHANVLGPDKLNKVAEKLANLHQDKKIKFNYYYIDKHCLALTSFFDCVFDQGLNPNVDWTTYWTPLRYLIILKLSAIFDEETLKTAWELRIDNTIEKRADDISKLLTKLNERLEHVNFDARSKEIINRAFNYGIQKPLELDFGTKDKNLVSPNSIGFQFVISSMARTLQRSGRKNAFKIVVDQQSQFNNAQKQTHTHNVLLAQGLKKKTPEETTIYTNHPLYKDLDDDEVLRKHIPTKEITISRSSDSIGLQLVDVYLWLTNRHIAKKTLPQNLTRFTNQFLSESEYNSISFEGLKERYYRFESKLPPLESFTKEQIKFAKEKLNLYQRSQ